MPHDPYRVVQLSPRMHAHLLEVLRSAHAQTGDVDTRKLINIVKSSGRVEGGWPPSKTEYERLKRSLL